MRHLIEIEDIEEVRRQEGIDDVELRAAIRDLEAGDFVKLTFVTGRTTFETVVVRITSIRGHEFRGKLAVKTASKNLSSLSDGKAIVFRSVHIHSIPKVPQHANHDDD